MNIPLRRLSSRTLLSLDGGRGLSGCARLPDQRLANEALKNGATALAEQDYRQLADLGYSDAQAGLAAIQVATRDPAPLQHAAATARAAPPASPRAPSPAGRRPPATRVPPGVAPRPP
ncbi:alginate biosynthesis protein, partial [Pseudomonas syringae]